MKQQAHLEIEMVSVDELKPYEGNAKIHDNRNVGQIASSIEEFNFADPIAAWHNDKGESVIIEGHGRLLAAQRLGIKELPVIYLDYLTDEQRRAYTIVHNSTTMSTGFDMEALAVELEGLEVDFDMTEFGFDAPEFDFGGLGGESTDIVEDEVPEDAPSIVQKGDVWQLGRHRLMCGDSTDAERVSRLMNGAHAELLFTSPPYADMRTYNGDKELSTELLARFIPAYAPHCEYQAVNLGIKRKNLEVVPYWDDYIASAHDAGLKLMAWNVWDKGECGNVASQSNIVPIRHEFIFVFGTKDKPLNKTWEKKTGAVDHEVRTTRRQADGSLKVSSKGDMSSPYKEMESVLLCTPVKGNYGENAHPAPFPIGLPVEYIKAFTDEGDVVAEPFAGSGTTLIACEQLGRQCRCMELDPSYCDVIIERWQNLTGETAVRVDA